MTVWLCPVYAINIEEIAAVISENHIDKPTEQALLSVFQKAITNYLQSLDPHSKYLTAEEYKKLREPKDYVGIGASIRKEKQGILIIPFAQGPAFKAGIKMPQILLAIDGVSVESMTTSEIVPLIKGTQNTRVTIETRQLFDKKQQAYKTTIKRQRYTLPSLQIISTDSHIPYIRINKFFQRQTLNSLRSSLQKLKKKNALIVIDLRETTGGDFYEALDCLSLFLPFGKLLVTAINNKDQAIPYYSLPNHQIIKKKLLILVGPRTASSAEIFAKALQHYQRALLIGQMTYGKCLSQTYIELSDGSVLKLSNLKILYPDGVFCNGKGLVPDVLVTDKQLYKTDKLILDGKNKLVTQSQ